MNKEVKKAAAFLDEREKKSREIIAKAEAETQATREKVNALRASLDAAEDAEQYATILQELRTNEAVLEFCDKRTREAHAQTLTPEEYATIIGEVGKAYDTIKKEQATALGVEIEKFTKLMQAYDEDVKELNGLVVSASNLARKSNPPIMTAASISSENETIRPYVAAYYRAQAARLMMEKYTALKN